MHTDLLLNPAKGKIFRQQTDQLSYKTNHSHFYQRYTRAQVLFLQGSQACCSLNLTNISIFSILLALSEPSDRDSFAQLLVQLWYIKEYLEYILLGLSFQQEECNCLQYVCTECSLIRKPESLVLCYHTKASGP